MKRPGPRVPARRPPGKKAGNSLYAIFAAPTVIAIVSIVGLVAGLLGENLFDLVSWIGLLIPVLAIGWSLGFRRA